MSHQFVIYKVTPLICKTPNGRKYLGDVPVCRLNSITKKLEIVTNNRGYGYAGRHRLMYRNRTK